MSSVKKNLFRGTGISVATAFGSTNNISGISNASPAVVTDTAHGLATNDVVRLKSIVGLDELNDQLYVITVIDADTFSLNGISTVGMDSYTSGGTWEKVTFTSACELTGYSRQTGSTAEVDGTTICSTEAEFEFGLPDPGTVTLNYKASDTAVQRALESSRANVTQTCVRVQYPSGTKYMFDFGVVTQMSDEGSLNGHWTGSATLRRTRARVDVSTS